MNLSKAKDSLEMALEEAKGFNASKEVTEVAHAKLSEDFEHLLTNGYKLVKGGLIILTK